MKKIKNPWMISTIAVSVVSVVVIAILGFKLSQTPTMNGGMPNGGEMPSGMTDGERPTGGPGENQNQDGTSTSEEIESTDGSI